MKIILIYVTYFLISAWLTYWVGNSLYKNGRPWIINLIGAVPLADKINNMLLLGYRLINIGYILLTKLQGSHVSLEVKTIMEFFSVKLGLILLILAWLHFQNIFGLFLFSKLKIKYKWEI